MFKDVYTSMSRMCIQYCLADTLAVHDLQTDIQFLFTNTAVKWIK